MRQIEKVSLRCSGSEPFRDGETPFDLANRLVADAVRPDAAAWSVVDVRFYCRTVDVTTPGDRLPRRLLGNAEWEIDYEVEIPAKVASHQGSSPAPHDPSSDGGAGH